MRLPSASLTLTPRGSEGGQTGACSSDASGSNHSLDCRLVHVRGKVGGITTDPPPLQPTLLFSTFTSTFYILHSTFSSTFYCRFYIE